MKETFQLFGPKRTIFAAGLACLIAATGASAHNNRHHNQHHNQHASLGPYVVGEQGVIYSGGNYDISPSDGYPTTMANQSYVFYQIPAKPNDKHWSWKRTGRYPIIMIHGSRQTGANFLGTPDGRAGWAAYYVSHGWPVYVIDQPGRGKSGYFPNAYGVQGSNPSTTSTQQNFTAPELTVPLAWPQAAYHTQWPGGYGSGVPGQYAYDQFFASQVANMPDGDQALALTTAAVTDLIKKIGPSVIVTHSMTGPTSWFIPQANPGKIKAVLAVEPSGNSSRNGNTTPGKTCGLTNDCLNYSPPISGPADLGITQTPPPAGGVQGQPPSDLYDCWLQSTPVHKPTDLDGIPILIQTGQASYHAGYDYCTSAFLTQAGVKNTYVYLPTVGIKGNGHMMMLEMNNLEIAKFDERWLSKVLHVRD